MYFVAEMQGGSHEPIVRTRFSKVADVEASARFYETHFGFTRILTSDWSIQLRAKADHPFEIALIAQDHDSIPEAARGPSKNVIPSLSVEDAAAEHQRLIKAGLPVVQPWRDEAFGQRHFIVADPDGLLVDIITPLQTNSA